MDSPMVGVSCIIVNDGRVLLGRRKGTHGGGSWAPPGGHLEFSEEPSAGSVREALEETGLKVSNPKFATLTNDVFTEDKKHYVTLHFVCRYESGEARLMEPEKCERWDWFEWDALPEPLFLPIQNLQKQGFDPLNYL